MFKLISDLSTGRYADQSSRFTEIDLETTSNWLASNAVDGSDDSSTGDSSRATCTHTQDDDPFPWWRVTFSKPSIVNSVRIANRADCCSGRSHMPF